MSEEKKPAEGQELTDQELEQAAGGEWRETAPGIGGRNTYKCPLCNFKIVRIPRRTYSTSPEEEHQRQSPGCKGNLMMTRYSPII